MKQALILLMLLLPFLGWSQTDLPEQKSLQIEAGNKINEEDIINKGTALRMPSIIKEQPKINFKDSLEGRKPIKMLDDRGLVQAGKGLVIDTKVGPRTAKEGSKDHYGDQNLGNITSSGNFIGIVARDHEFVDGDRVKIYLNETVIDPNMLLTGAFKGINVDLNKGFNRLEFEAINVGSSPPNTAQVDIYNDKGELIYSSKWVLSRGSKASLVITKE